jgi:hypothetical protein
MTLGRVLERDKAIKLFQSSPNAEKFTGSSSKGDVRPSKVMHRGFRQHSIVLQLGFAERRAVASNQHELG